jgi:hypothetical protein
MNIQCTSLNMVFAPLRSSIKATLVGPSLTGRLILAPFLGQS